MPVALWRTGAVAAVVGVSTCAKGGGDEVVAVVPQRCDVVHVNGLHEVLMMCTIP